MRAEPQPRRSYGGPLLLVLPLVLFGASILYLADAPERRPVPPRAPSERQAAVQGWVGELRGPDGARLVARLTRLHAQPERQAFDRAALARRFGLPEGEPWRLSLQFAGGSEAPALRLAQLEVRGERGGSLAPPAAPPGPLPKGELADPLAVLLAPPAQLRPGEEARLVLWGRAPEGAPALTGLVFGEGEPLSLALEERALEPGPDESVLASLERTRPGGPDEEVAGGAEDDARDGR